MYGTYRNRESYLQGSALLSNGTHTQRRVPTVPVRAAFEQRDGRDARKNARSGVDKDECHACLPRATQVVRTVEIACGNLRWVLVGQRKLCSGLSSAHTVSGFDYGTAPRRD